MLRQIGLTSIAATCAFAGAAHATVSAEEAKTLGNTLTPWDAEVTENREGTIPTGSLISAIRHFPN